MAATMAGQTLPQEATAQNRLLRSRSNRLAATVLRLWHKHAQPDFDTAFADMMPELFRVLDTAQYHTAADAIASTPKIMERFDVNAAHPEYKPDPWQWVGVNGNGMDTVDTMWTAITIGKRAVSNGAPVDVAVDRVGVTLVLRTRTMLADTHRSSTSMTARGICYRRAAEDASSSPDGHAARRLSKGIRTATASPSTPVRKHRQTHAPVRTNTSTVSPTTSSPKSLAEGPTPEPTRTEPTSTSWLTPNAASAPPRSTGGTSSTRLRAPRATDSPHHA